MKKITIWDRPVDFPSTTRSKSGNFASRSNAEILIAIDRQYWMSADEAREYGIVDHVK
jgi:ATP-dependent protease ClpP protease subunit